MKKRKVITVDGLAGTGKTTISKKLAEKLGFIHFSTGILYRTVGLIAASDGIDPERGDLLAQAIKTHTIEIIKGSGASVRVLFDSEDVQSKLYSPEVSEVTSKAAANKEVREALVSLQREAFPDCDIVAEGRDMGTVIFPDADIKFFIEVDEDVRVERRLKQMMENQQFSSDAELAELRDKMKIEVLERDERDSTRDLAPTVAAEDAILVNNSRQTLTQVLETMYHAVSQNLGL